MQATALLLRWGSYCRACNLWVLIVYFSSLLCCPLCFQGSAQTRQWECFLVFGNFSLFKTPFPGWNSVPPCFVSFLVFYIFSYLLLNTMCCFSGCWCPLLAFRSCFVEFTRCLNVLLMNLWGRKCSPRPIPLPSSDRSRLCNFLNISKTRDLYSLKGELHGMWIASQWIKKKNLCQYIYRKNILEKLLDACF